VNRGEFDRADELIGASREALADGLEAVAHHPSVRFAGYLQDAQREYAEASLTLAEVAQEVREL